MNNFVELYLKRNRGWPWPEDSFGLTPMFGEDGWCHDYGVPTASQTGSIVLRRQGMKAQGAWVPNWNFDVYCVDEALAQEIGSRFRVTMMKVEWRGTPVGGYQIVVPTVGPAWFDQAELRKIAVRRRGTAGARCAGCGTWRWMPLPPDTSLPPRRIASALEVDVAASPEWFGDGYKAFREIVFRRELAEMLVAASPRDFKIREVAWR